MDRFVPVMKAGLVSLAAYRPEEFLLFNTVQLFSC